MWTLETEISSHSGSKRGPFRTNSWLLVPYFAVFDLKALGGNG
jgi:hypothetical protein